MQRRIFLCVFLIIVNFILSRPQQADTLARKLGIVAEELTAESR